MNIDEFMCFVDMQNYTDREIEIIYGEPTDVTRKEISRLFDKATEKYNDWRIGMHILHKYRNLTQSN